MPTDTDIAYIAGIIDGEGCIRIKTDKPSYRNDRQTTGFHAMVQVKMVDEDAIRFIAETLGGWYYRQKPNATKGRPLYCWQVTDKIAESVLRAVLPYLRVKRDAADTVLKLRDLQATRQQHRTKITGYREFPNSHGTIRIVPNLSYSDEYITMNQQLADRIRELNRVGVA